MERATGRERLKRFRKRFDASLEWLTERIGIREEEIEKIRKDEQMERRTKSEKLKAVRMTSIAEVLKR